MEAAQNKQAAATASAATASATSATLPATPMAAATTPTPKFHQNEAKISNTISTEQSLLIQNRSMKKASVTNAINKPTIAASAGAHTDHATTPNQTSANEIDLTAPQSIAYVAGRKFIMVPKAAKTHTSPDLANDKANTKSS